MNRRRTFAMILGMQALFGSLALAPSWIMANRSRFVDSTQATILLQSRDGGYENESGPGCTFTDLRFNGVPAMIRRDPESGDRIVDVPVRPSVKVSARLNGELWVKTSSTMEGVSFVTVTCDKVKWDRVALIPGNL